MRGYRLVRDLTGSVCDKRAQRDDRGAYIVIVADVSCGFDDKSLFVYFCVRAAGIYKAKPW